MSESTGWHELKTWPEPFDAIEAGSKTFEFRKSDRRFEQGDMVSLLEWDPAVSAYTGRCIEAEVGFILRAPAFGVPDGYVVFSLLHVGDVETRATQHKRADETRRKQ